MRQHFAPDKDQVELLCNQLYVVVSQYLEEVAARGEVPLYDNVFVALAMTTGAYLSGVPSHLLNDVFNAVADIIVGQSEAQRAAGNTPTIHMMQERPQ